MAAVVVLAFIRDKCLLSFFSRGHTLLKIKTNNEKLTYGGRATIKQLRPTETSAADELELRVDAKRTLQNMNGQK
jgi:hypothetical protein